jgi:sugar transferase EpsL
MYNPTGKRLLDVCLVVLASPIIIPIMLILMCGTYLALGRPIFFRQTRPGLHCRPFTLTKLRTMKESFDADGNLLPDEARITRFGMLLRSTSMDELPEFWHVLRGEMSLVGPRPLLMKYLDRYSERQMSRHNVMPGITGWAQINGRNEVEWDDKLNEDIYYVEHVSLILDIVILLKTVPLVLARRNISFKGEFLGSGRNANY